MDYGKLAYLKTEDIEYRLNSLAKTGVNQCSNYTVSPSFDMRQGVFDVTKIRANGTVTLIVKFVLKAQADVNAKFLLLINGMDAGESEVSCQKDAVVEKIIMCSAYVTGSAQLSVKCDTNALLTSVQVLCVGVDVDMDKSSGSASIDKCGDTWVLVSSENDDIKVFFFNEEGFVLDSPYFLGTGKSGDVTAWGTGYAFCYTDRTGNTFVRSVDSNMRGVFTQVVATNSDSSAITAYDGYLHVAYCDKGKIYVVRVDKNGGKSQPVQVNCTLKATSVAFVKNAPTPMLIVYDGQRSVMKNATEDTTNTDAITLALIISVGS